MDDACQHRRLGILVKRTPVIGFIAGLWLALFALVALAQSTVGDAVPGLRVARLVDMPQSPDATAITSGSLEKSFQPVPGSMLQTSSRHDLWYRLELDSNWSGTQPLVLSFRDSLSARVWVYAPPTYQPHLLWLLKVDRQARFSRHALAEVLPAGIGAGQPIYVRLGQDDYGKHTTAQLTGLPAYQAADLDHVRLVTLFASIQAAMVLVGFSLWLVLRDRLFLYFIGYVGTQLIYSMLINGELYELPGGWLFALLGTRGNWPFALISAALSISFIIEFCDLRRSTPRAARLFGWMRWPQLAAVPLFLLPLGRFEPVALTVLNLLILVASMWAIATVALALFQGNRQARFFIVAWMPQVAFTIFRVVQLLAGWHQPAWIEYGFPLTMAFASLVVTLGLADQTMHVRRERDIADHLARHDPLTGALSRRAVLHQLDIAVAEAHRSDQPLALLFLDVDHFKSVNDAHGHAVGDRCLQAVVASASHELRTGDWLGRLGGEEFIIGLPGATRENAHLIGERVRVRIQAQHLQANGHPIQLTASVGVAGLLDSRDTADALLERADAALYKAKAAGRNRVFIHPSLAAIVGN